jgi:N-acetylmuramidase
MFTGVSKALSTEGICHAASNLAVDTNEIRTILTVETGGCGFLPDRRPRILFERHCFHRLTGGRFDDGEISDPAPGGWGPPGAHQYGRLARAMDLDRQAALQSTSWGLGQILGENYRAAGFPDVDTMVKAMVESEDAQVLAMSSFMRAHFYLANALKTHDWVALARGYNGPGSAASGYASRLRDAFAAIEAGKVPDLRVRAAQLYMTFLGLNPGPVDGVISPKMRSALAVQKAEMVDDVLIARLEKMLEV